MTTVDVSIITVNYNNAKLTLDFVNSLVAKFPKQYTFEVIVIDNASTEPLSLQLETTFKTVDYPVIFHKSAINLGFGAGNMLGVQFAKGKYLAFINNDVIITEDCFSPLIDYLKANDDVAVCSPQQLNIDNKPVIGFDYFQGFRKELFGRSFIEKFIKNHPKRKDLPYKTPFEVPALQGCFMFFKAEIFAKIGGFDTNLFLYFEEMDLCFRLKQLGYKSVLAPTSTFKHLESATVKANPLIKQELMISRLYIYRKNYSYLKYKCLQFIILLKLALKALTSKNRAKLFWIVFQGAPLKYSLKQKQQIVLK